MLLSVDSVGGISLDNQDERAERYPGVCRAWGGGDDLTQAVSRHLWALGAGVHNWKVPLSKTIFLIATWNSTKEFWSLPEFLLKI